MLVYSHSIPHHVVIRGLHPVHTKEQKHLNTLAVNSALVPPDPPGVMNDCSQSRPHIRESVPIYQWLKLIVLKNMMHVQHLCWKTFDLIFIQRPLDGVCLLFLFRRQVTVTALLLQLAPSWTMALLMYEQKPSVSRFISHYWRLVSLWALPWCIKWKLNQHSPLRSAGSFQMNFALPGK